MALAFDKRQTASAWDEQDPNAAKSLATLKSLGGDFLNSLNPNRDPVAANQARRSASPIQDEQQPYQKPMIFPRSNNPAIEALTRPTAAPSLVQQGASTPASTPASTVDGRINRTVNNGVASYSQTFPNGQTGVYKVKEGGVRDKVGIEKTIDPSNGTPTLDSVKRGSLMNGAMNKTIMGANGPYQVSGSPDAVARLSQPVAPAAGWDGNTTANEKPMYQQVRDRQGGGAVQALSTPPEYMKAEPGGPGWQTRLAIYKEQTDAYNRDKGLQNNLDVEAMREAGAGARSLAQAAQANQAAEIDRQRLGLDKQKFESGQPLTSAQVANEQAKLSLANEEMAARKELTKFKPGTPEYSDAERRLATLSGRFGEQKQPNIQVLEEPVDPKNPMAGTRKFMVKVNPDGSGAQRVPVTDQGGGQQNEAVPLPQDASKRVAGQVYVSGSGKRAVWDGKGLVLQP